SGLVAVSILGDLATARAVAVVGGSFLVLGWVLGPLLIAGTDATVDAARLAPFPLTRGQLMVTLTSAGLTGIPGIATVVAAVATVILWMRLPAAAVSSLPAIVIGVLTCVVASRLVTTISTGFA